MFSGGGGGSNVPSGVKQLRKAEVAVGIKVSSVSVSGPGTRGLNVNHQPEDNSSNGRPAHRETPIKHHESR